ncbi:MAG: DciA family protein [bacterium]
MKTSHSFLPPYLVSKLRENEALQRHLEGYLSPAMRAHVAVANLGKQGKLTLLVSNQTLATTLRYQQSELIKHFSTLPGRAIQSIQIKVSSASRTSP